MHEFVGGIIFFFKDLKSGAEFEVFAQKALGYLRMGEKN